MPAATSIAIAALIVGVAGTVATGIQQRNQANFQSDLAQQQADRAKLVAEANEQDFRKKVSSQIATVRAAKGELEGSELLAMEDFVAEAELDALTIRNQGIVQQSRLEQQANLFSSSGKNAAIGAGFRSGAQLLTGFSSLSKFGGGGGVNDSSTIDTLNETSA